jgi:uncharacterized protein YutE (UPF0331/DUF86 family)
MLGTDYRNSFIHGLWDEHLKGGVTFTEFATFMANDAETAFEAGADLAAILAACSTIETYVRWEILGEEHARTTFKKLIEQSDLQDDLKDDLQKLREFRNRWVHVHDAGKDEVLLERPHEVWGEISEHAEFAMKCMIRTLCSNQWV